MKTKKSALVINPWVTDFKLYDEWMHPIGLYFLMSLLKFNNWDIHYINCLKRDSRGKSKPYNTGNFPAAILPKPKIYTNIPRRYKRYGIDEAHFIAQLQNALKPDKIFIGSGMTYWIDGLVHTVTSVQKIFPGIPVIIGGNSATLIPHIIKQRLPDIEIFSGPLSPQFNAVGGSRDTFNFDTWEPTLINAFKLFDSLRHGPLLTSFGCPLNCTYCASSLLSSRFRIRNRNVIMNEVSYLINHLDIADFALYDDAMLYQPKQNFLPLADEIGRLNRSIRLHTPNGLHIRWVDEEIAHAMKQCGFVTLRFGYESGNSKHAHETCGKTDRNLLEHKVALLQSAGFRPKDIGIYVMGGFQKQNVDDFMKELDFVASLKVKVKPVFLSPVPHTPIYSFYAKQFPQLNRDPLYHNDLFFITQLPGWDYSIIDTIKGTVRDLNSKL